MWRAPSGLYPPKPCGARRGWSGARQPGNRQGSAAESPAPPYGPLLLEIDNTELEKSEECPLITSCQYVSSYTWLGRATPSILVPGEPPIWSPATEGSQLKPDRGEYFRDPNAARYPSYPWQASFEAIRRQSLDYDIANIDIVTCSSTFGNLIRFARGMDKDFRFIMETAGDSSPEMSSSNLQASRDISTGDVDSDIDGLIARLQEDHSPDLVEHPGKLTIQEAGRRVDQRDIIDIKTRSMVDFKTKAIKKEIDMTDLTPRLWVSQIPTLIVAYHNRGLFEEIRVQDMRDEIIRWERENEEMLRRVAWLLHELVHYAKSSMTRLEVCRSGAGPIQIRRVTGDSPMALAPEMKARLTGRVSPDVSNHRCISSRDDNFSDRRLGFDSSDSKSEYGARDSRD
ncbi:hypothetical protein AtubIFM57143_003856 [Aspergillus tubingensis]|nr:hypothetical protein AtubIFM57143_003856 [Aspergillus tubingensis]